MNDWSKLPLLSYISSHKVLQLSRSVLSNPLILLTALQSHLVVRVTHENASLRLLFVACLRPGLLLPALRIYAF